VHCEAIASGLRWATMHAFERYEGFMTMPTARKNVSASWTFLSNFAHVLICIAQEPTIRLREIAVKVGITERAVQKIVLELEAAGAIERHREGRRNNYSINYSLPLRHKLECHKTIGDILTLIARGTARDIRS